jgi:thiol-disulfide isomerase/thioredoxin
MKRILLSVSTFCMLSYANAQLTTLNVGDVAPNFTVTDLEGHVHTKADYANKYLLVDLFAYWCGPCAQIAPIMNQFYIKYGCNEYDIAVLAVEYEGSTAQTQAFETANGGDPAHPTPTVSGLNGGGGTFHSAYQVDGFPTSIIIGPDGLIKTIDIWPISNIGTLESAMTAAGATLTPRSCATGGSGAGIEELTAIDSKLYPNPSTGTVNFEIESSYSENVTITVLNVVGKTIYSNLKTIQTGFNKTEYDFSTFEAGTYFFKVTNEMGNSTTHTFHIQ